MCGFLKSNYSYVIPMFLQTIGNFKYFSDTT